jgi:DNA replication protein DnaC
MKDISVTEMDIDNTHRIIEIIGRTGSGKTTIAQQIAMNYTKNGKHVVFFQRKDEVTASDVISKILIATNPEENSDVAKTKPDLIILDDFVLDPMYRETRSNLYMYAEKQDFQIIITRQTGDCEAKIALLE